ncbi:hypothetical protein M9434_005291 [Picochlorum sp. BPE23]|nr:hypothetical protein M9434_005291 [Picochlorum sp. BPE23]
MRYRCISNSVLSSLYARALAAWELPTSASSTLVLPQATAGLQRWWVHEDAQIRHDASNEKSRVTSEQGKDAAEGFHDGTWSVKDFPQQRIRNFSIIAHIDHGKSTLADRMMEYTGAIRQGANRRLDTLQVEKERGITVKAQTSSLVYSVDGERYLLNLIDTPGHVDFSYEVSRSLAACDGALLLVDAAQGIQAQTVANFFLAFEQDLAIIPVLNKIDMPAADPEKVAEQLEENFDLNKKECIPVSAKTGLGVNALLRSIVERIPAPKGDASAHTRMLVFDAYHDEYRGVVCLILVVDGKVQKGDKIASKASGDVWDVLEVGLLTPDPCAQNTLFTGQVGYILTGMKNTKSAKIGDTWHLVKKPVEALPGFREPKSMVFAGIFPINAAEFDPLQAAMEKLTLNDSSVQFKRENSSALGAGFRCGFLGLLHMDVFRQRLEQEHGASVIITAPTVPIQIKKSSEEWIEIQNPAEYPTNEKIRQVMEPTVLSTIILPSDMLGGAMTLCQSRRGELVEHNPLSSNRVMLRYIIPLSELGGDFYDELKSLSSGYASFDYEEHTPREADLVRMDILVNGESVDALARVVHRSKAEKVGREVCQNLKKLMSRQQFDVALQASAGGRIVSRETIKSYRKNVLAKCYGGDISRKRKLLEKQKQGKKKLRKLGSIEISTDALHQVMQTK